MKKILLVSAISSVAVAYAGIAFAAGINLYNGGLGQVASNPSQFGVAICNGGKATVAQSVPVAVAVNGQTMTLSSPSSIAASACSYIYSNYSQFGMQAGKSYSVAVTIDPQHTAITNSNNQATYSVQVPSATVGAQTANGADTADVNSQSGNIFIGFWNWLRSLF